MIPNHVETINVDHHFCAFEFVEFFANGSLLLRCQAGPWPVGPPVVVLSIGDFNVIVKANNLINNNN